MPDKREILCLVIFTVVCILTVTFLRSFVQFSDENAMEMCFSGVPSEHSYGELSENVRDLMAYSNHYAISSGIFSFIFVLLCGLFLFNILVKDPDHTLLLLAVASALFAVNSMACSQGSLFMPAVFNKIFSGRYIYIVVSLLMVMYVIFNRKKYFIRYFAYINATALVIIHIYYLISVAKGEYIPAIIRKTVFSQNAIYYIICYFLFACFLAAYIYQVGKYARAVTKSQMLRLQNKIISENYNSMVNNIQRASAMRHEWKNSIIALGLMYKQGKTEELGEYIEKLNSQLSSLQHVCYTENFTIDTILQNAAEKARENNINFKVSVYVPKEINIPDGDLCSLLINMLENSIEACGRMPEGKKRFVDIHIKLKKDYLNISCKNSYSGTAVIIDPHSGIFESTKPNSADHGFGINRMSAIAKKYDSLLDINFGNGVFTVQTSLKNTMPKTGL